MPKNIKCERVRLDLTIEEAASRLDVAKNTLTNWELGKTAPNGMDLIKLSGFYGCSTDWLLGLTEERLAR